jgi:hypothetical protein
MTCGGDLASTGRENSRARAEVPDNLANPREKNQTPTITRMRWPPKEI